MVKINNRKILSGIAETIGAADKIVDITVAIDKIDKIGLDNVNVELKEKGLSEEVVEALQPVLTLEGGNADKIEAISEFLKSSETGRKGVEEIREVLAGIEALGHKAKGGGGYLSRQRFELLHRHHHRSEGRRCRNR